MATPLSSAPPPFIPINLDPSKDSGKEVAGTSAHPEKPPGRVRRSTKRTRPQRKRKLGSETPAKGKWWPCTTTEMELKNLESEGFLQPGSWRSVPDEPAPAPRDDEMVLTKALVERGFSFPPSEFFLEILKTYGLQPHNISPNSVLAISNHVALCEGHLRVTPEISLFQHFFSVKKIRQAGELATCGSITFMLRPGRVYPPTDRHESARYWSAGFFYLKDVPTRERKKLPAFKNCPAVELPSWTHCPHFSDSPHRPALEALEENELGTLLRVPSSSNMDPEAASEAEAPEASRPAKRKKPAPSSPRAKRAREVPSTAATRKLEAEKKRLSLINTGNRGQSASQHFFKPSGQPPKAPKTLRKTKPSPAPVPITPDAGVPPKASSTSKPDPKDIINVDDLPEDPAHHGDSAKGTSSPIPPPDQPSSAFAEPTEEEQEQKVKLLQVTNATRVHLQPTPSFQKLTLSQRHAEVSAMLNKVWTTRKLHEDLRVHVLEQITEIEGLRQNAENGQKAIQLLETRLQEETAKHSKWDELSARVQVLEAENESLKDFVKTSASQEHQARKELREKHARDLAELNDKLEKSQGRVISVISKNKALEAEAEAIDKLIFQCFSTRSRLPSLSHVQGSLPLAQPGNCCARSPKGSDMSALLAETEGYEQLFVRSGSLLRYNKHDLPEGFSDAEEEAVSRSITGRIRVKRRAFREGSVTASQWIWDSDDGSNYQQSEEEDSE
ncbi:hypothetical protein QYE76_059504 [Lolium multiflorum]|uniref:Transposase (putative) gypsy type domain-containing protein n=1 Tax=Lolium multiflorum TaxID=4521 RepID=A0AAD8RXA3_LOLMU|nr:hypothetical protein QYE76_059504 [Lolium multiflorum]